MSKKRPKRFFEITFANGDKIKTVARHEKDARSVAKIINYVVHKSKITSVKEVFTERKIITVGEE